MGKALPTWLPFGVPNWGVGWLVTDRPSKPLFVPSRAETTLSRIFLVWSWSLTWMPRSTTFTLQLLDVSEKADRGDR